jgi:hypothetical protein
VPHLNGAPAKWSVSDLVGLQALQPLAPSYVAWTAWSMSPAAVATVVNEILVRRRSSVVELGSGTSTIFLAKALQSIGGQLLTVEHDRTWARYVTDTLEANGLQETAEVVVAELEVQPHREERRGWRPATTWYDMTALAPRLPPAIDLLVVDGPPSGEHRHSLAREPAVSQLSSRLATDGFAIMLDDATRAPEAETVRRWEELLGIQFTIVERIALAIGRSDGGFTPTL